MNKNQLFSTEGMKRQAQELIEQAYQKGYKAGQESAFVVDSDKCIEQGRNESWEVMRKILMMSSYKLNDIFEEGWFLDVIHKFSASEAIVRFRAYEEQNKQEEDEIKVGDEVAFPSGTKFIVLSLSEDGEAFDGLYIDGSGADIDLNKSLVTKTGRHFPEIAEVLKKMKESE